jgi:anti-sigma regulatory factor (Ser/Thr protein kinase)
VIHPARVDCEMRMALPATFEAIEEFFTEFRRKGGALLGRVNCFTAELLLREALTNAVLHGCHGDPRKQVRCVARMKGGRLLIVVADDGDGFDWRGAFGEIAEVPDCSGRGLEIFRRYANHVRYSDRGNLVAITKRCAKERHP